MSGPENGTTYSQLFRHEPLRGRQERARCSLVAKSSTLMGSQHPRSCLPPAPSRAFPPVPSQGNLLLSTPSHPVLSLRSLLSRLSWTLLRHLQDPLRKPQRVPPCLRPFQPQKLLLSSFPVGKHLDPGQGKRGASIWAWETFLPRLHAVEKG